MKYVDEYRDAGLIKRLASKIEALIPRRQVRIMEVCGTHTQNFFRFRLDALLPKQLKFISGPGCPVCVSAQGYIDQAVCYCRQKNTIIATFGDMLRVPGTTSSLEKERAQGGDIRIVYSALDALELARQNARKKVIFLAVGFETTAPTVALSILRAREQKLKNIFFYSSLKLIPPAMRHLLKGGRLNLDGFLCPGHVSVIIGLRPYEFIPKKFKIGCCVSGFEPLDILEGIYLLLEQIAQGKALVANQYQRVVTLKGNPLAQKIMAEVFSPVKADWRGLGEIAQSGLGIRKNFQHFDAEKNFPLKIKALPLNKKMQKCRCAEVLRGLISPFQCPLFAKACTPLSPLGPCMISSEGACNAYYKYKKKV